MTNSSSRARRNRRTLGRLGALALLVSVAGCDAPPSAGDAALPRDAFAVDDDAAPTPDGAPDRRDGGREDGGASDGGASDGGRLPDAPVDAAMERIDAGAIDAAILADARPDVVDGGAGSDAWAPDAAVDLPPSVEILFPPPWSVSAANEIEVIGHASDDRSVTRVEVAGVLAASSDGFRTWEARVPLLPGETTLTVEVEDSGGATARTTATVARATFFQGLMDVAFDPATRRLFALDGEARAILEFDPATGEPDVFSSSTVPDATNAFAEPVALVLDAERSRLLVIDRGVAAILAVDLTTGARTVLSDATRPSVTLPFSRPRHLAIDAANDRAYVLDSGLLALLSVDLLTGARTLVSNNTTPSAAAPFVAPVSIALDPVGARAFVLNFRVGTAGVDAEQGSVLSVDLATGARTVLSSATVPDATHLLGKPTHIGFDAARSRLIVLSQTARTVFAVDPTTGARTVLSSNSTQPTVQMSDIRGFALDPAGDQFFSIDLQMDHLTRVSLASGARTLVANNRVPRGTPTLGAPVAMARDATGRLLMSDSLRTALVSYDPATGSDAVLVDLTDPELVPRPMVLDAARARVLGLAEGLQAFSTSDGAMTTIATFGFLPQGLALDAVGGRALVTAGGTEPRVYAVALDTGSITVLSGAGVPDSASLFDFPGHIVWDEASGRALVLDNTDREFYWVDGVTGARSLLTRIEGVVNVPAMVLDPDGDRLIAFVYDGASRVVSIDLVTGVQTIVHEVAPGLPLIWGDGLVLGALPRLLWVSDSNTGTLHLIDLESGSHVLVRRGAVGDWLVAA